MRGAFLFINLFFFVRFLCAQDNPSTVNNYINNQQRQISKLSLQEDNDLPIGIEGASMSDIVQVQDLELLPNSSFISVSAVLPLPMSTEKLELAAHRIPISEQGFNGGEAKMFLQSPVNFLIGDKIKCTILSGSSGSYVNMDCDGLKEVKIKGVIEFCRSLLLPENNRGEVLPEPYRVKADFEFSGIGINNIITRINIPPFQIKGLNGYSFLVEEAWFDRSDVRNPEGIIFPSNYQGIQDDFWRGIFIKQVKIKLPDIFKSINNSDVSIQARNMLLDHSGLSGEFNAINLVSFGSNQSSWKMSLDTIGIKLSSNVVTEGMVSGRIKLPFFDASEELFYTGVIGMNDYYSFRIRNKNSINVSMWLATLNIAPTSTFDLEYIENKWRCALNLNGSIDVHFNRNNYSGGVNGVQFEGLEVSTEAPYIRGGSFYTSISVCKLKGFNVSIKNITHTVSNGISKLGFLVDVHFFNSKDLGFQGSSEISIESFIHPNWQFRLLNVESVRIDIDKGVFALKGELDTPYDKGFNGKIEMKIKPGIVVMSKATFGVVDNYNFWNVAASVRLPKGIPIYPSASIWGFSGGLSYHMNSDTINHLTNEYGSEREFIPDSTKGLGLSAGILIAGNPNQNLFQIYGEMSILFNGMGVSKFTIDGKVLLLHKIDEPITNAPVYGIVSILLDFENDAFHANAAIYINAWNIIQGIGPNNMAGYITLHFSPNDWYVHIGKPDSRIGVELLGMAQANAYLLAGKSIPPMPPPSAALTRVLNVEDLNMMRDENVLANGSGLAFGAALQFSTGHKRFLIFYGEFSAGIEFDIMLKNYGKNVYCENTGENLGVEGWYASGQIGAYIQGEIGVEVDLPCYKGSYSILEIGAGVLFQAKLPNPIWMRGMVGGYFSILGGLVEGSCRFEIEVGRQCEVNTNRSISYQEVVREITPFSQNLESYSSLVQPEIYLNIPLNKNIALYDNNNTIIYRVLVEHISLYDVSGESKAINWQYDSVNNKIKVIPLLELTPGATYRIFTSFVFQKYFDEDWETITENSNINQKEKYFKIQSDSIYTILLSSIKSTYPISNQSNYYINEFDENFIAFNQLQNCLGNLNGQDNILLLSLNNEPGFIKIPYSFSNENLEIQFSLKNYLKPSSSYQLSLYHISDSDSIRLYSLSFETSSFLDFISFMESTYYSTTWIENSSYAINDYILKNRFESRSSIDPNFVHYSFDLNCKWLVTNYAQMYDYINQSVFRISWRMYDRKTTFPENMIVFTNNSMDNTIATCVFKDLYNVKAYIANSTRLTGLYNNWLYKSFTPLQKGDYNIVFEYIIPYRNAKTSSFTYICQLKL